MLNRRSDQSNRSSIISLGFISKHMEDQAPLMKVIAGAKAPILNLDRKINVKVLMMIFYIKDNGTNLCQGVCYIVSRYIEPKRGYPTYQFR